MPDNNSRKASYLLNLRQILWLVLLLSFLVQTHYSITKYRNADTSMVIQRSNPDKQEFPSITFCPLRRLPFLITENSTRAGTFEEAMKLRQKADNIKMYQPAGKEQKMVRLNLSSLPDDWTRSYTISPYDSSISECYTYTAPEPVTPGYYSQLKIVLEGKADQQTLVYINKPGQTFLVPTQLFGRYYIKLPILPGKGFIMYQINTVEHERMPTPDIPCHEDENASIAKCITSAFEASIGCKLPWRARRNSTRLFDRKCSTNEDWKAYTRHYTKLLYASEKEIYDDMGCFYTCKFKSYSLKQTMDESSGPLPNDLSNELILWLYLAPNGLILEKEILVYDLDDLVGNVGGSLGLFLGASILSMYDSFKVKLSRLKCFL